MEHIQEPKTIAKAMKKKYDEHMASVPKGFKAVTPRNMGDDTPSDSPHLYFPDFRLKVKDIPIAKDWEVGKKYRLELLVEQSSLTDKKGMEPEVEFTVLGVKALEDKKS